MKTVDRLRSDWVLATEIHKLEARLWHQCQRDGLQVILVTSAVRGEGKSTTVSYVATAVGQYPDRRVLAVDLDMRQPQLAANLGVDVPIGIEDVLLGRCPLSDAILRTELPGLDIVSPKLGGGDAAALLRSAELYKIFQAFREQYSLILVDAPAVMPVADTSLLLPLADGVLLAGMAGKTTKHQLQRARDFCLGMGANIVGLVVGNIQEAIPEYGSGGSYYEMRSGGSADNESTVRGTGERS